MLQNKNNYSPNRMAGCRTSSGLWTLLSLFYLYANLLTGDRHAVTAEYITVRKDKIANGPAVVDINDSGGDIGPHSFPFDENLIHEENPRVKRDVHQDAKTSKSPEVSVSHLNDSHQQVMIQWGGEGSSVIICLLRNAVQNISRPSSMFISKDYGTTYENISSKFETSDGKLAIISTFYNNKVFHSRFVFTDVLNNYIYVTKDYGSTIVPHKVRFTPSEVMFHPLDAEVLLIHDTQDSDRKLWISEDFGNTWRLIGISVDTFFTSEFTSPPTLYIVRKEPEFLSVLSSQDLFREGDAATVVIESIVEFEVKDEFLFAVKKSTTSEDTLNLLISYRGGRFHPAVFPNSMRHKHYYIADVSEGQVMVCVAHREYLSNLYVSSVPRSPNHPVKFSLSLERIVFFKPSPVWEKSWLSEVADKQFADLHQVKGIRGVFIAAQFLPNITSNSSNKQHIGPEHTVSYISFDQGAQWKPLQPPQRDVDGRLIDCKRSKGCSLHVGQSLSYYDPRTDMTQVVSKESAPGLILATGTIGPVLRGHTSLYVSVDAGINWFQVLRGSYRYAIGDHGGILVAVQHFRTAGEIDTLYYSTDDGESWNTFKFSDEKLRIYGLLTEPGENTTIFTLFGSRSGKHQWIFVKVDLRSVFLYNCSSNDYKSWSPSDGRSGRLCLLGRKQVYERRIPHSNCYSGTGYDRPISIENCPCDGEDFECDFGFIMDEYSHKCVKDPDDTVDPYAIPSSCNPGGFYNHTKGYRLIPGDTCEGGRDYQYNPTVTACPVKEDREFLLVSARQEILKFDLMNPDAGLELLPIPVPHLKMVIALDFDLANNCIFWSDVNVRKIFRLCFDGSHDVETLVETDLRSVEGLAFDWVSKNLYFIDGERKTLEVIRTDITNFGRMRRTLLDSETLDKPRGIAVHPTLGYLYLTDWSETSPKVAQAYMDGRNFTTLFGAGVVGWPNGITIDFHKARIFFVDAKLDFIASADLDGSNMKKIITDNEMVSQPFAVGIYKSTVFWDDWTVKRVMEADKEYGWGISPIANFTREGLVDLKVYGPLSQKGSNVCANQTQFCKYLCLGRPNNGYSCLCPDGLQQASGLSRTEEECRCPNGSPVDENGACKSLNSTCPPGFFKCDNNNCVPEKWVCDEDDDCGDRSDEDSPKCGSPSCNPLYWQCSNGQCIPPSFRCDHHPDCNDSSDEVNCHHQPCDNSSFTCANGKCIHRQWQCDMEDDCRDGSDEVNCTQTHNSDCKSTEFTCKDQRCIPVTWRCDGDRDCSDGSDEDSCQTFSCSAWQFACNTSNKCIYRNWQCDGEKDCDDGSDEVNCTTTTTTTISPTQTTEKQCSELMFKCGNGHCIPFWWRCDALDDCGDMSDEEDCPKHNFHSNVTTQKPEVTTIAHTCRKDQFQCRTGTCIWDSWVCDNDLDCPGGEDEVNCPVMQTCADLERFQCRRSSGCIQSKLRCDGHDDCPDGSDEEGCSFNTTPGSVCPSNFFKCDGWVCLPLSRQCDGNQDCLDLSDEQNCTIHNRIHSVTEYTVMHKTNVSLLVEWKVDNAMEAQSLEYMLSYSNDTTAGNHFVWKNMTWTTDMSDEVCGLSPYTYYVLKVYVREKNGTSIFPPFLSKRVRTKQGVPSPPQDVKLERKMDIIRVTWKPPSMPSGVIKKYNLFMDQSSRPIVSISGSQLSVKIPQSYLSHNVSFWLTAENDEYMSAESSHVQFHKRNIDQELNVTVQNVSSSSASLSWDAVEGVDGYVVGHDRPENVYLMGNVTTNTSKSSVNMTGLAPGLSYMFWVRSYKGDILGPERRIRVMTEGKKLLPVQSLQAAVTQEDTAVKLSWTEPSYKIQKVSWIYRVIWGKTSNDLKHSAHLTTTPNTTLTIRGLDACETYRVAVMVGEPIGIGPVAEKQVVTGADAKAPPKNLRVRTENVTMVITWEDSCPQGGIDSQRYLVTVRETSRDIKSYFRLLSQKNRTRTHNLQVHWGGRYSVQVRTAVKGAAFSQPVLCNGPEIPAPYELVYNEVNSSFFWRNSEALPEEISSKNYSYVLYVSENTNMSDAAAYACARPPLVLDTLDPGIIYYVAVALKDVDGYLSLRSQALRIEKSIANNELVISQGSAVGVGVSVFLVVVALVVVVGVLAVRHRRLARSIITFTNTHYDSSQGTTLITTDHNLDEDDDSPMIRGFSDDEPLVIA